MGYSGDGGPDWEYLEEARLRDMMNELICTPRADEEARRCLAQAEADRALGALIRRLPADLALVFDTDRQKWLVLDMATEDYGCFGIRASADSPDDALRAALGTEEK